jgi:hypothetical protein
MKMIRESLLSLYTIVNEILLKDGMMASQILRSLCSNRRKMTPMREMCQKLQLNQIHLRLPLKILLILEQRGLHAEAPDYAVSQHLQLLVPRLCQMELMMVIWTRTGVVEGVELGVTAEEEEQVA